MLRSFLFANVADAKARWLASIHASLIKAGYEPSPEAIKAVAREALYGCTDATEVIINRAFVSANLKTSEVALKSIMEDDSNGN